MTETQHHHPLNSSTAANLLKLAEQATTAAAEALERYRKTLEEIAALEAAGITNASIFMRDDKYMYLVHPTQEDGTRQREYIGADATKQAAARARLERHAQHQLLTRRADAQRAAIQGATRLLDSMIYSLKEK